MKRLVILLVLWSGCLAHAGKTVLYSFQGGTDGFDPNGPLVSDSAGNFYGTTFYGGDLTCNVSTACGTVFELLPDGHGGWTETVLHRFTGKRDGQNPFVGLTLDSQGNLYGTTMGPNPCSTYCGSVFELSPSGSGWTFTTLHAFQGKKDGGLIEGGITIDASGNLYGTTRSAGPKGGGTVFRLSKSGNVWSLTTVYAFDVNLQSKGLRPAGSLVLSGADTIYGVTLFGGGQPAGAGVFYSLCRNAKGKWIERVLYSFAGGKDGAQPWGLYSNQNGSLYGASPVAPKAGNVFRFTANENGKWSKKKLYTFGGGFSGGPSGPSGGVLLDSSGNVLGMAGGGALDNGSFYELNLQSDGKYIETQLYSFEGGGDGLGPNGPPILDAAGNLYAVTAADGGNDCGGSGGCGTVSQFSQ
jgi:uncharacterized repeat protein (TIGR03803 family)